MKPFRRSPAFVPSLLLASLLILAPDVRASDPVTAGKPPGAPQHPAQGITISGTAAKPSDTLSPPDSAGRPPGLAIDFSCVLQVEEGEAAAKSVIALAESLGGWFTRRSKFSLELRIPTGRADAFLSALDGFGIPLDRKLNTQSLEAERTELAARLAARRAMIQDYYAMLQESADSTVFTIQSEIIGLQSDIEQTAAQIAKLEDRMAYASMSVDFRFFERGAPLASGHSRFGWINRLGLPVLMGRYEYDQR